VATVSRYVRKYALAGRTSNGPLEGTDNKIKTMQRMAYGYRDREFFKLKIYALHECKYAFVG
jgi:transposase